MSVYFITAREVGMVKIGCAYKPETRLRDMQVCCPVELVAEATFKGAYKEERALHARFAEHRVRGEWFKITPEIEALIASGGPPTTPFLGPAVTGKRKLQQFKSAAEIGDIHFPFRAKEDA